MSSKKMTFEESLMAALKDLVANGTKPVYTVSDHELSVAAHKMVRAGYDFSRSPNSLMALRAYLEGKSLVLAGSPGVGKTYWFKSLSKAGLASHRIHIYSLTEHGGDFMSAVLDDIKGLHDCELVLDDVGTESNWNGKRNDEVLTRVLAVRENVPLRTHFTTNLSGSQLRARYDERVVSRLRMSAFIPMAGADNRQVAANDKEAAFRRKCEDPANWRLCEERCTCFENGHCEKGETVPPLLRDQSPETMCGVGKTIPYRPEELAWHAQFKAEYARKLADVSA